MPSDNGKAKRRKQRQPASDPLVSYDEFKEYEGQRYTGVKIGRGHSWNYDAGRWKEKKITPDLWEISYAVTKRRAGRAPEGSGVPVDTEYHWYILAHQNVRKLNANDYTTSLAGLKFKIAHKRAATGKWSATPKTQRKRMIKFLREVISDLEQRQDEGAGEATKQAAKAAPKQGRRAVTKNAARPKAAAAKSRGRSVSKGAGARRGKARSATRSTRARAKSAA